MCKKKNTLFDLPVHFSCFAIKFWKSNLNGCGGICYRNLKKKNPHKYNNGKITTICWISRLTKVDNDSIQNKSWSFISHEHIPKPKQIHIHTNIWRFDFLLKKSSLPFNMKFSHNLVKFTNSATHWVLISIK